MEKTKKYAYPAIFYPENDGRYSVIFPDLNDLATYGSDFVDAFDMAQEACAMYLFESLRDGESFPVPTPINKIFVEEDDAIINMVLVDLQSYARLHSDKSVKKTLSIPAWLSTACDRRSLNYSKVLQEALIEKLQQNQQ